MKTAFGSQYKELLQAIENVKNLEKENYAQEKSIGGITELLLPKITRDFKDFNKDVLFGKVKEDIVTILNAFSNNDKAKIAKDQDLILMREYLEEVIDEKKEHEIEEVYQDIDVGKTAIQGYAKQNGTASITLSSNVSYYYKTNDKNRKTYDDVKKSVRIDTEYVYVYDETKWSENRTHFSLHCPNCGAPLKDLSGNCAYCTANYEPINLRAWKMNQMKIR